MQKIRLPDRIRRVRRIKINPRNELNSFIEKFLACGPDVKTFVHQRSKPTSFPMIFCKVWLSAACQGNETSRRRTIVDIASTIEAPKYNID